jgi:acetone carboxylase gamma subunit
MSNEMKIGNVVYAAAGPTCEHCGTTICGRDENWKEHSLARRGNAAERLNDGEFGDHFQVHENEHVELAELFCPNCKALLTVELYLHGEPYRREYQSLESASAAGYDAVAEFRDDADAWVSF